MITLVRNIRQLLTPTGTGALPRPSMGDVRVVDRPVLVLRDERIVAVETGGSTPRADRVIDAEGGIVVPGLVDACVVTHLPPSSAASGGAEPDVALARLRLGVEAMVAHGTTSAEARTSPATDGGSPEEQLVDLQRLAQRVPLRLSVAFCAAPRPGTTARRSDRISEHIGEAIPSISRRRLASACIALCGDGGYSRAEARAVLRAARGAGLALRVQASGDDAEAVLLAAESEAVAVDHLTGSLPHARTLAQLRKCATVAVLLPTARLCGERELGNPRGLIDGGIPIALGTGADLAEGGVYSLWTALALAVRSGGLSATEALTAATLNAAAAIGAAHNVGTIEPGKFADFVILGLDDFARVPDFVVGLPIRSVVIGGNEARRC